MVLIQNHQSTYHGPVEKLRYLSLNYSLFTGEHAPDEFFSFLGFYEPREATMQHLTFFLYSTCPSRLQTVNGQPFPP